MVLVVLFRLLLLLLLDGRIVEDVRTIVLRSAMLVLAVVACEVACVVV